MKKVKIALWTVLVWAVVFGGFFYITIDVEFDKTNCLLAVWKFIGTFAVGYITVDYIWKFVSSEKD